MKLTPRERRFLTLLLPEGATIAMGLRVGSDLCRRGLVHIAKYRRYGITVQGREALAEPDRPPAPVGGPGRARKRAGNRPPGPYGTGQEPAPGAGPRNGS